MHSVNAFVGMPGHAHTEEKWERKEMLLFFFFVFSIAEETVIRFNIY